MAEFQHALSLVAGLLVDLLIGGYGIWLLILMVRGKVDLSRLISEPNGDASLSRFQLLIFTLVVALSLFVIVIGNPTAPAFPDIPGSILSLLGISASSYLVSKGIQFSDPNGVKDRILEVTPKGIQLATGATQQFTARISGDPSTTVTWSTSNPSLGTITAAGLYTAVAAPPAGSCNIVRAETADGTVGTAVVL
ncbi:MAG TPA: Ig-like domain-containing protein [Bryobacteraceae bacterium]|nr:Ig-like domain-containing protein [Bryobacteraceae bacterium]